MAILNDLLSTSGISSELAQQARPLIQQLTDQTQETATKQAIEQFRGLVGKTEAFL